MDRNPLWNRCGGLLARVVRSMTFAVATIIAVYLPIPLLQGLEGRMSRPNRDHGVRCLVWLTPSCVEQWPRGTLGFEGFDLAMANKRRT